MDNYPENDPRAQMMEQIGANFADLCNHDDGREYAVRYLDGRVQFVVSVDGIRVFDQGLAVPGDN